MEALDLRKKAYLTIREISMGEIYLAVRYYLIHHCVLQVCSFDLFSAGPRVLFVFSYCFLIEAILDFDDDRVVLVVKACESMVVAVEYRQSVVHVDAD